MAGNIQLKDGQPLRERRAQARLFFGEWSRDDATLELRRQLEELPAFRALVRSAESLLLRGWPKPQPVLDFGCGDGHFAAHALVPHPDVGVDLDRGALREAHLRGVYRAVLMADGTRLPLASASLGTVIANSVLEHIPPLEDVLNELVRVLRPGGRLYLTVPGPGFSQGLSLARLFDRTGLRQAAQAYRRLFNRISRHVHVDPAEQWIARLRARGLEVLANRPYLPLEAMVVVEWGHASGFPLYLAKKMFGRYRPWQWRWKQDVLAKTLARFLTGAEEEGAYWFFAAEKPEQGRVT